MRWPGALHGRGRSRTRGVHHGDQGQEHHHSAGRAPPTRPRREAPRPAATSAARPGTSPTNPTRTTGSSRPRASRFPTCPVAPTVVAVTSLAPDHLDWHGTVERYYADKLSLCTKPGVELALASGSDLRLRAEAALLGAHVRWVTDVDGAGDAAWSDELGLPGQHNARNATMARQILLALAIPGADDDRRLDPGGVRIRRAAQPVPIGGHRRAGRVRRRQPVDQRAARPRPLSTPSTSRRWRCWWVVTTVASTTRPWDGPSPVAAIRPSSSPCPTTGPASAMPCVPRPQGLRWSMRAASRKRSPSRTAGRSRWRTTGATTGKGRKRRGAPLPGCPELRSLQRLPRPGRRLRRRGPHAVAEPETED